MFELVKFFVNQFEKKNEENNKAIKRFKIETTLLIKVFNNKSHHEKDI